MQLELSSTVSQNRSTQKSKIIFLKLNKYYYKNVILEITIEAYYKRSLKRNNVKLLLIK